MPDSDHEIPPEFNSRRTFDPGTPATAQAKKSLGNIVRTKVLLPKSTYVYQPLASENEIRVLRIKNGRAKDTINCTLIPSALASVNHAASNVRADILTYDALSYWWGDDDATKMIILSSHASVAGSMKSVTDIVGTFYIRSNLEAALRQIRSEIEDVDIWVDAICINQEDKKEKTAQVQRMDEIYTEAKRVCIWLGAGGPEAKDTFDFLYEILDLKKFDKLVESRENPKNWKLVVRLMENRWFSRRWVIQELALAKTAIVLWGNQSITWSKFADAIALFMTKHDEIKRILNGTIKYPDITEAFSDARALGANTLVNATNNLFRKSENGKIQQRLLTLEVLVSCQFLAFEASDPRDTIYAVLSMAKDTSFAHADLTARTSWMIEQKSNGILGSIVTYILHYCGTFFSSPSVKAAQPKPDPRIAPDYNKSLLDVCADFMDYCIQDSHSLDILCRHWAPPPQQKRTTYVKVKPSESHKDIEKLPSWIPSIKGYAFGAPEDALNGRMNGDSFVGNLERQNQQHYNASAGLWPCVRFGKCEKSKTAESSDAQVPRGSALGPSQLEAQTSTQPTRPLSRKFDGTLFVKGCVLGQITSLSGTVADGVIPEDAFSLGGWPLEDQPRNVPDQLWRTLVADRGPNGTNAPSWYHRACRVCLAHRDTNGNLNTTKVMNWPGTPTTIVSFLDRVQRVVWNRRAFQAEGISKKGRKPLFGLASHYAKQNDIVCIIFGCSAPVLLRKYGDSDNDGFKFVGECYVHGHMDGEATPRDRPIYPYKMFKEFKLR
jgi:hypothetical protein